MLHSDMQKIIKIQPNHNLTQIQQIFTKRIRKTISTIFYDSHPDEEDSQENRRFSRRTG